MKVAKLHDSFGFTIVELLVVIVVIGVLAAITLVTYSGISQKAVVSALQSDLNNASTQLKLYYVDYGKYPDSISLSGGIYCPSPPDVRYCLKVSNGNTFVYVPNSGPDFQAYSLTASSPSLGYSYIVTNTSKPTALSPALLNPVADWIAVFEGDHYGNYYDLVGKQSATVNRASAKTIYDPNTQRIYDVPANKLGVNPRSDGKNGNESLIEEGRTNYVLQSSFENIMSDWHHQYVANGSSVTSTDKSVYGSYSLKITRTQAVSESNVYNSLSGLENSTVYSYSAWAWANTSNTACIYTYTGSVNMSQACHSGSGKWERLSGTFTSTATGTIQLRLVHTNGSSNLNSVYFDAVQVEKGSFVTSYIPTLTTVVSRDSDVVSVLPTNWKTGSGSVLILAKQDSSNQSGLGYFYRSLMDIEIPPNFYFIRSNVWGGMENYFASDGIANYTFNPTADVYWLSSMSWTANNLKSYLDGTLKTTDSSLTIPGSLPAQIYIGSAGGGTFLNGFIPQFTIYDYQLSDSDMTTVTNSIKNGQ